MQVLDVLNAINLGESADYEFKSARGGVPKSLWETYSAMANTDGGTIILGIEEKSSTPYVTGVTDLKKKRKNLWDTLNDRGKISINLLSETDLNVIEIEGKRLIVMQVPRAMRRQRPVFIGQNPLRDLPKIKVPVNLNELAYE